MSQTRVYLDASLYPDSVLHLPADAAKHITRVLRLRVGMSLVLFNGQGGEFDAEIVEIRGQNVMVQVGSYYPVDRESPLSLCLVQAMARNERMDLVVQKAVELGVSRIEPVFTERSVVRLDRQRAERRLRHWRNIVISACEQCQRNRIPEISKPVSLGNWMAADNTDRGTRLLLHPGAEKGLPNVEREQNSRISLLVGPEGGADRGRVRFCNRERFYPHWPWTLDFSHGNRCHSRPYRHSVLLGGSMKVSEKQKF